MLNVRVGLCASPLDPFQLIDAETAVTKCKGI